MMNVMKKPAKGTEIVQMVWFVAMKDVNLAFKLVNVHMDKFANKKGASKNKWKIIAKPHK